MSNEHLEQSQTIVQLKERNRFLEQQVKELSVTNEHLVTATWRERKLKEELRRHQNVIETQTRKIADSINYAKKIQKALTVTNAEIRNCFRDSFMLYFPKDVVSGDYPWFYQKEGYAYIAAVDCTGHGVPGAMLAVVSCLLLNDIINDQGTPTPAEVLNRLNKAMLKSLRQHEKRSPKDGLDIALTRVHLDTAEVQFSGASRPFFYTENGELHEVKGDFFSIGGDQRVRKGNDFTNHCFQLSEHDTFYLFSDGLPDQFCHNEKNKFGLRPLREGIKKYNSKEFTILESHMTKEYLEWKGECVQTDDILLIGIRI